jgi:antitoxin ParD1/3/4
MPSSYTLGDHFQAFIQEQVRTGRYATASEVIRDGLRLLEESLERREAELEALRNQGSKRHDQYRSGRRSRTPKEPLE